MGQIHVHSAGPDDSTITICLSGAIDVPTTQRLRGVLVTAIMRRRATRIVVDLGRVTDLDGVAIGTLQAAWQAAGDVHSTVVFHDSRVAA